MNLSFKLFNSLINNLYIIITINIFFINIVSCYSDDFPKEIKDNYFQLNLLSSGKTMNLNYGNKNDIPDIICSYDSEFSYRINNNKNEKSIICLDKCQFIYIFNNETTYLYKFDLVNITQNCGSHFNLIPYSFDNNIYFIISYIENNDLNMIQYQIDTSSNTIRIAQEKKNFGNGIISSLQYPLNCTVTTNNNNFLICFFLNEKMIYLYKFGIGDNFNYIDMTNVTCNNCLETGNHSYYSDLSINQDKNQIFLCYKVNRTDTKNCHCYFYNIINNSFKTIKQIFQCKDYIKNYYYNESKEYIIICHKEGKEINLYNSSENNIDNFTLNTLNASNSCKVENFFLYIDSSNKEYNLMNDCYRNHSFIKLLNLSYTEYIYNSDTSISTEDTTSKINYERYFSSTEKKPIEEVLSNISRIFNDIMVGENYIINGPNYTISIKPTTKMSMTKTSLNLSDCESVLRTELGLNSSIITLLQIEINNPNSNSLINKVEYKLFDENFTELDLNKCNNTKTEVVYKLKNNSEVDYDVISYYTNFGIDVFNISDIFFNDLCQVYPDFENDVIMEDRINYIYQNFTVCEEGCSYEDINVESISDATVTCECDIKTNISIQIPEEEYGHLDITTNNFQILKCYNLIFSSDDKINNLGFWLFTFILGSHIPIFLHFISTGLKPIHFFIVNEMTEYGYIKNNNNDENNKSPEENKNINIKKGKKSKKGTKGKKKKKKTKKSNDIEKGNNNEKGNKNDNEKDNNNDINNKNTAMPPPKNNKTTKKDDSVKNKKNKTKNKTKKRIININSNLEKIEADELNSKKKKKSKKSFTIFNKKTENNYKNTIIINTTNKNTKKSKKKIKISKENIDNSKDDKSENAIQVEEMQEYNDFNEEDYINEKMGINLININLNNPNQEKIPSDSNKILNNYTFEEAIKFDLRSTFKICYIFLLSKQVIFHTFLYKSPLELISIRAFVFLFIYSNYLFFNAFFYFNSHISEKFKTDKNLFSFTFSTNMTIILLSTLLSFIMLTLITKLSNSTFGIREIFKKEEDKMKKDKNYIVTEKRKEEILKEVEEMLEKIKCKIIWFFVVDIILMLFYWYYLTAFGHIYSNTQYSWILDSAISIIISFIVECVFCLLFAKLYRISIESNIHCMYKFVMFLYNFA